MYEHAHKRITCARPSALGSELPEAWERTCFGECKPHVLQRKQHVHTIPAALNDIVLA